MSKQYFGSYIGCYLERDSEWRLFDWAYKNKIPSIPKMNPKAEKRFHITILYSKTPLDIKVFKSWKDLDEISAQELEWNPVIDPKDLSLERFGNNLVVKLRSQYLQNRFEAGILAGATVDYKVYSPHITIGYDSNPFVKEPDWYTSLKPPEFPLFLEREYEGIIDFRVSQPKLILL